MSISAHTVTRAIWTTHPLGSVHAISCTRTVRTRFFRRPVQTQLTTRTTRETDRHHFETEVGTCIKCPGGRPKVLPRSAHKCP
jgi:hypothetical protein